MKQLITKPGANRQREAEGRNQHSKLCFLWQMSQVEEVNIIWKSKANAVTVHNKQW